MASIRIGLGTEFNLKNNNLGINTTTPQERLDVAGVARAKDLNVTGISSLTAYEGFLRSDNQIDESIDLEFGNGINASLSGEIIVGTGVTVTLGLVGVGTTGVGIGTSTILKTVDLDTTDVNTAGGSQIECLKVYNTFTPPNGGTNERPEAPKPGELYYNFDFKTIEFFDGYGWRRVDNTTRSGRGLFAGGNTGPATTKAVNYISIPTTGNALEFGDLIAASRFLSSCASATRAIIGAGTGGVALDYFAIASKGNGTDYGDLSIQSGVGGVGSSTRGLFGGGYSPSPLIDKVEKIEIATLGGGIDFADLFTGRYYISTLSSPTRGLFTGGMHSVQSKILIDSITFSSGGKAIRFGDMTQNVCQPGTVTNSVRGVIAGGAGTPDSPNIIHTTEIQYVTLASEGRAAYFGDLNHPASQRNNGASTQIRGVFGGGMDPSVQLNNMEYVTIATAGNAIDFGDLPETQRALTGCSDSHGGLGGF